MATRTIQMRLDGDLVAEVDELAGPRGRTAFVAAAIRSALSAADPAGPPPRRADRGSRSPVPVARRVVERTIEVEPRWKR